MIRLGRVLVEVYCASYAVPPATVTLDIDDTCDVVHGHQQLCKRSVSGLRRQAA